MKHLKRFNEELTNISKIRKWPTYGESSPNTYRDPNTQKTTDYYFVYDLNKNQMGKYLNVWFQGQEEDRVIEPNRKRPNQKRVYYNEVITLKKTDEESSRNLYNRKFNPVSINIMNSYKGDEFDMKAQIHSIDDSSYGIWWINKPLEELKDSRTKLMDWLNYQPNGLNGEEFLNTCISLGADEDQKDYN